MTGFRRRHVAVRGRTKPCSLGFPDTSCHSVKPWVSGYGWEDRVVGVMFAGREDGGTEEEGRDDLVYLGINAFWEAQQIELPRWAEGGAGDRWWIPQEAGTALSRKMSRLIRGFMSAVPGPW